jgi:cellulose synthase/poly-beta-1,6-N-acetylglucosamine synthase-like glycosyltransferase
MDLAVRLHRYLRDHELPDTTAFIPDPVAWTEVPSSVRVLSRQRERWHRGLLETLWVHRDLLFNARYGAVGLIAYPFFLFGEALSPLVELFGYLGVAIGVAAHAIDLDFVWLFLSVVVLYGMLLSVWAILLEEVSFRRYTRPGDVVRLLLASVMEAFFYRPLTLVFRLRAFWRLLRGDRRWGEMKREGFGAGRTDDTRKAA